jgi:co-chaperonin GroES (HSP10)
MVAENETLGVAIGELEEQVTKTSLRPTGHSLIILPQARAKKTQSGIVLPSEALKGSEWDRLDRGGRQKGQVLAIGPQCWAAHAATINGKGSPNWHPGEQPVVGSPVGPWCEVGDTVLFAKYSGKTILDPVTGQEVYIIHDEDILAVYEEEAVHGW